MKDLYEILGISKDATDKEIKRAYKQKVKTEHPDVGGDEEAFKHINFAWEILSDKIKKEKYDRTGYTEKSSGIDPDAILREANAFIQLKALETFKSRENYLNISVIDIVRKHITHDLQDILNFSARSKTSIKKYDEALNLVFLTQEGKDNNKPDLFNDILKNEINILRRLRSEQAIRMLILRRADHQLKYYNQIVTPRSNEQELYGRLPQHMQHQVKFIMSAQNGNPMFTQTGW